MGKIEIFGKKYNYEAYQDEMYMHKIETRLINDRPFMKVFQKNITDDFIKSLKRIVDPDILHEENIILQIFGETGSGKSATILSLCKMIVPDKFSYKNICFFDNDILELAKNLPRDTFIIRDEGVDKAVYGVGSQRISTNLTALVETTRKAGLSICFIEPEPRDNELCKYYLEVVDRDIEKRLTRLAVKDKYTKQYLGAIYIPVLPENHPDMIGYNRVKDDFISDMKSGKMSGAKQDFKQIAMELLSEMDLEVFTKKKDRLAFIRLKHNTLTNAEVDMLHTIVELLIKSGSEAFIDDKG